MCVHVFVCVRARVCVCMCVEKLSVNLGAVKCMNIKDQFAELSNVEVDVATPFANLVGYIQMNSCIHQVTAILQLGEGLYSE